VLTQAPTGSTGSLAQVAGTGIEPVFEYEFKRSDRLGEHVVRLPIADELIEAGRIPADRAEWPDYMVTSRELTPTEHVDMQAVIQKWNDSAISKTVNAPKSYTVEDVKELYMYAYKKGLKGITVYVDGSRDGVLNYIEADEPEQKPQAFTKRPEVLRGNTIKTQTPFGKAYVTINENAGGDIEEIFVKLGKTGADISAIADGLAIALTGVLSPRLAGLTPDEKVRWIIKKFRGMSGANAAGFGPNRVDSLPDAVARALQKHTEATEVEAEEAGTTPKQSATDADICPSCGTAALVKEEGCSNCKACGFSKCN
jgi:ribonucleoside-diphosphate reductase alpha chain